MLKKDGTSNRWHWTELAQCLTSHQPTSLGSMI